MTYGLAADLHFHLWSAFAKPEGVGKNNRLDGLLSELKRLARETCNAAGARAKVVLAGDIFHVRGSVSPTVLNAVRDTLAFCVKEYEVEFIILAGNHDLEGKNSERLGSAITALEMPGVTIVNETMRDDDFVLIPWHETVESLKAEIESCVDRYDMLYQCDLILHAPIDGVIEGLPEHGLTPAYLGSLGFRRVFAGHYHNHKDFGNGVYSIGALAHHTWSDVGSKAGFLLVDDASVNWRKSRLPEFIDANKLDVDEETFPFIVDKNYVRVRTDSASAQEVTALREELENMGAVGTLIQSVPKPPERNEEVTVVAAAGESLEASIAEFVKRFEAGADEVLKESLAVLTAADQVEV